MKRILLVIFVLLLSALACEEFRESPPLSPDPYQPTSLPATESPATQAPAGDSILVLFTDPTNPTAASQRGGPDADLAAAIDQAQHSVDLAVLQLNLWSLRDALIAAHQRGVRVRMVTEEEYLDEEEVQELMAAGIPVVSDHDDPLMHHKFVVIDGVEVWSGSMNFSLNDTYHNNNNLIRIRSTQLAQNYTTEFEEMFLNEVFGAASPADTPNPVITVDSVQIENYFSPDDGVQAHIVGLLAQAEESIQFLAFSFTADEITEALIAAHRRGVVVSGVLETRQISNTGADYEAMLGAGIDVRLDGNPKSMHHKVLIIDGAVVITGSYNFSASAEERNDENILVIHSASISELFYEEFLRIYQMSE